MASRGAGNNQTGSGSLTSVGGVTRWAMGGPDAGEAAGLGVDRGLEAVVAPRALQKWGRR
jgi:hypothetical protein